MMNEYFKKGWGSTFLKNYLISPLHAKFERDKALQEDSASTPTQMFGSAFHKFVEHKVVGSTFDCEIFDPPINPTTGKFYGKDTQKYAAAAARLKNPIISEELQRIKKMFDVISNVPEIRYCFDHNDGIEPEFFDEEDQTRWKPDLSTSTKLLDWKTCEELSFQSITRAIYQYHYDIQAAHYQYKEWQRTGAVKSFYFVFIQSVEPFDYCIVDMQDFIVSNQNGMIIKGNGHLKYMKILEIHKQCLALNKWEGINYYVIPESDCKFYNPITNNQLLYIQRADNK
jgi:hypothetical protein